jgi:anthraniloyl-CoA monooxygenase
LHEAAKIGVKSIAWPKQYYSAKLQFEANLARASAGPAPR